MMIEKRPRAARPAPPPPSTLETARRELARRMAGPQRHRLLQGHPALPLMPARRVPVRAGSDDPRCAPDPSRALIVGVLPHPFCNPRVKGCGFCTFPHQRYRGDAAAEVCASVAHEVTAYTSRWGIRPRVAALYLGGATANMTPPDVLGPLLETLASRLDLSAAEATLEGAPVYFRARRFAVMDLLRDKLAARQPRVSMGVQTFDRAWLARMGREAFGDEATVRDVVAHARALGMTASCDLLVNLPGQPVEAMVDDVRRAADLGLDQVCVYHLVLFEGLGTAWSEDPAMLAARPDNARACAQLATVREALVEAGYVQTTLTNFERREVVGTPRAFAYEPLGFAPGRAEALGFGPASISGLWGAEGSTLTKWVAESDAARYVIGELEHEAAIALEFAYEPEDLRLLEMTRSLARCALDGAEYTARFGARPEADFPSEFEALFEAGLLARSGDGATFPLTETGLFYADAVAGLLAARRAAVLRRRAAGVRSLPVVSEAAHSAMG